MDNKILIIKRNINSFEKFYNDKFESIGIRCFDPYIKMGKMTDFICHVFMHFNLPFHNLFYGDWKKEIKECDTVIVFDWIYSHNIITDIESINPNCKIIFWFWNRIEPRMANKIIKNRITFYWTFDYKDALNYKLHLNTQFYAESELNLNNYRKSKINFNYDVFFCGTDKGRLKKIELLKQYFDKENISYKLIVKANENIENKYQGIQIVKKDVEYNEIIASIKETRCILDLTNDFQTGLTIRTLEALFYSKLLITDNKNIKEAKFYNPKYIYIIGEDKRSLNTFLSEGTPIYNDEQKKYYCIEEWVKRFND